MIKDNQGMKVPPYLIKTFFNFRSTNMDIKIFDVKHRVRKTSDFFIGFDNIFDFMFNKVIERINMLLYQS